jgi:squalene-hopene/tetraprenyl-beta-curcumene cyclase
MLRQTALTACCLTLSAAFASAADVPEVNSDDLQASKDKAVAFLRTTQAADGSWTSPEQPGISGLVTTALLKSGVGPDDPPVKKALAHLETFIQPDGGIYFKDTSHKNYETSIAIMAFAAANEDGRYDSVIANATEYLKGLQWDEGEGIDQTDPKFGGAGYGRSQRPDLSNTSFFLDALKTAGVPQDDEAFKNALVFVSRTQNLESEFNNTPFAALINDGGFYYTPAAGGTSQAGANPDGGLRSYASMTYAGLKSMIYCGLSEEDPRVAAATEWIRKFYSLDENPGLGNQGLFYYYHTFAKALDAMGVDEFEDATGVKYDWRNELAAQLISVQQENGSWVNSADRWYEGNPDIVTAYCLLAYTYCSK